VIAERSGVSVGALQHLRQRDRAHVSIVTLQRLDAAIHNDAGRRLR
jgi:hypothetical protein